VTTGPKRSAYVWSFVMSGGQAITATVASFVLARIVGPESYGVVAMGLVYVMLIQMLLQQGLGAALVQRRELDDRDLRTVFAIIMTLMIVLTGVSLALSGWWAGVNNLPKLRGIIVALTVLLPIRGLIVIPDALLRRGMEFKSLAARANFGALAGGAAGIGSAVLGAGIWALVVQQLVAAATELIVLLSLSDWRPSIGFDKSIAREVLGFSSGTFLASFGGFVVLRADAILMGLFFGPLAVGLYRFALRLVNTLVDTVQRALQNVALPVLSRYQSDEDRFRIELQRLYAVAALVAWPAMGIIAGSSEGIIGLLGSEWSDSVTTARLLSLAGAGSALTFVTSAVLTSLGRPHLYALIAWMSGILNVVALLVAGALLGDSSVSTQIAGVAIANIVLHAVVNLSVYLRASIKATTITLSDIVVSVRVPAVAALSAAAAGSFVGAEHWFSSRGPVALLAATGGSSTVAAAAVLVALTPGGARGVVRIVRPATGGAG